EKLSSVTPMVLRNSGRVGSRRFFREKPLYRKMQGLSCFRAILSALPYTCLVLLALLFFSLFCLLSWGQQIFSGDYFYTCEVFFLSLLLGYYIVSYPYHIIYLASISSYVFLFLSLKKCSVSYVRRSFIYISLNRF
ncbi:hypothetical protein, partial [Bacteroides stercoris]|uniref:hypothetical protein n=1 Tax=Bacteroides stercoris TaxID=46506 RepID=UPI000B13B6C6